MSLKSAAALVLFLLPSLVRCMSFKKLLHLYFSSIIHMLLYERASVLQFKSTLFFFFCKI